MSESFLRKPEFTHGDVLTRIGQELNVGSEQSDAEEYPQYSRVLDNLPLIGPPLAEVLAGRAKAKLLELVHTYGTKVIRRIMEPPHG